MGGLVGEVAGDLVIAHVRGDVNEFFIWRGAEVLGVSHDSGVESFLTFDKFQSRETLEFNTNLPAG